MNDMVNHPKHYNAHPCGVECIDVIEKMTPNLCNATKYLWRGGLKAEDATEDYRKAEWYLLRSLNHVDEPRMIACVTDRFWAFMLEEQRARRILQRPSPWSEPIRKAIGCIFDLHGKPMMERSFIYAQARMCIQTAIHDEGCRGLGLEA